MYVPKVRRARLLLHLRLIRLKAQRAENFCGIVTTCKNYYRFESHHIQSSFVPLFVSTSFNVSLNIYFWFCTMWLLVQLGVFHGFLHRINRVAFAKFTEISVLDVAVGMIGSFFTGITLPIRCLAV